MFPPAAPEQPPVPHCPPFPEWGLGESQGPGLQVLSFPQDTLLPVRLGQFILLNQINHYHSLMLSTVQENSSINIMRSVSPFPLYRTSLGLISAQRGDHVSTELSNTNSTIFYI